jgi:lambda family phage minor tail protein L
MSRQDLYGFAHDAIIDLLELDFNPLGYNLIQRMHPHEIGQPIIFNGQTYAPVPLKMEGFETSTRGLPTPKIQIGNALGTISALLTQFEGLQGAKFTRFNTLAKYLNLPTNPNYILGDPDVFFVDRASEETRISVTFELRSVFEVNGLNLPRRYITQNNCTALFKSAECGYTGPNTSCTRNLAGCSANFGSNAILNINAFPGVDLIS